jgi:hypothetical protein
MSILKPDLVRIRLKLRAHDDKKQTAFDACLDLLSMLQGNRLYVRCLNFSLRLLPHLHSFSSTYLQSLRSVYLAFHLHIFSLTMRYGRASALLVLGLSSLTAGEVPTFTLGDPTSYLGNVDRTDVGGSDIIVNTDNGVTITFGSDLSKKIVDVAANQCKQRGSSECLKQTLDVMGVGNSANGLQKRVIPVLAAGVGVALAYVAGAVWTSVYVNNESKNYHVVELKIPQSQVISH